MSEATSLPEKKRHTKDRNSESRESCWKMMDFFRLLEEMETKKISEKSGRNICKGPVGSKIEYSYNVRVNDSERKAEKPGKRVSRKSEAEEG
ncbi:hypothetical protein FXV91_04480 [Methanosarcina sp. DH2]|uniref:hypothetical protein n=1 Tax=Methanosarcina sp. DH2 TaxID=2605639 RepID=UPI001E59CD9C|nr:hypothetical protein [Methanosarcina sp. DH2]MCC4769477.1 hypothetical protein [Methanosarcina sp. DH2]